MMKKFLKASLLLLVASTFTFCSGDDSNSNDNNAPVGQLIATIDGELFSPPLSTAQLLGDVFNVSGLDQSTGETLTITIEGAEVGTFDLGPENEVTGTGVYTINGEDAFGSLLEGGSGELTISELDLENETASGTFYFTGIRQTFDGEGNIVSEMVEITDGAFNQLPLITEAQGGDSSLTAEVNGEPFQTDSAATSSITFNNETSISVSAFQGSQNIGLRFPAGIEPGDYELGGLLSDYQASYYPTFSSTSSPYVPTSGILTITSSNESQGTYEGTFYFTAERYNPDDPDVVYEVTNGSFSLNVQ